MLGFRRKVAVAKRPNGKELEKIHEEATKDPTSLLNIMLGLGWITEKQIQQAIEYQKEHREELIGQALVKTGAIDDSRLQFALNKQKELRTCPKQKTRAALIAVETAIQKSRSYSERADGLILRMQEVRTAKIRTV